MTKPKFEMAQCKNSFILFEFNQKLWLHKKLEILYFLNTDDLLHKRSELIAKCRNANKYLPLSRHLPSFWCLYC